MYNTGDTIAAISTPLGEGGIGIVRISGSQSVSIVDRLFHSKRGRKFKLAQAPTYTFHYGYIVDPRTTEVVDEVLCSIMKAPHSYTREDVVEINSHGGIVSLRTILELVLREGVRLAEPGEFTKRAFLNGRIDLVQAEAVMDIVTAKTDRCLQSAVNQLEGHLSRHIRIMREGIISLLAQIEATIDFPEDEVEGIAIEALREQLSSLIKDIEAILKKAESGRILREGINTIIVGKTNVGKSSLLNALLREKRAIVTEIPGTTRDSIEEFLNLSGVPLRLVDTAGIRETEDIVERMGVERTYAYLNRADLILMILDVSSPITDDDLRLLEEIKEKKAILIFNKMDLPRQWEDEEITSKFPRKVIFMSLKDGWGIEELEKCIIELMFGGELFIRDSFLISNVRHKRALERAQEFLSKARDTLDSGYPLDMISVDLRSAAWVLGEITGESVTDELLEVIFSRFCIGK